jgi:lipoprotein-releasing system permease protein
MKFELLVATRYLKAKRRQAVISLITLIAIVGVGAGVAALVIALAVSAGLREDLQERLLGAQAHLTLLPRASVVIEDYKSVVEKVQQRPEVIAVSPYVYQGMMLSHNEASDGVLVKGVIPGLESGVSALAQKTVEGNIADLTGNTIAVGKELADALGIQLGDDIKVISPVFVHNLVGAQPQTMYLKVVAIYSLGLFEYDTRLVFVPLDKAQYLLALNDVVSGVDVKLRNIDDAARVGQSIVDDLGILYSYEDWQTRNRTIFQALKLERLGMITAISLIVLVAALNIVAMLIMMVLEKSRDIAILVAMGANTGQIRRIFIYQGVVIGVIGTVLGLITGNVLSYVADTYRLIAMEPDVYAIAYLPFKARLWDSVAIGVAAMLVSFLATLYPSAAASKLQPVEALRYE